MNGPAVYNDLNTFLDHLSDVLYTEPGWETALTMERLYELIRLARQSMDAKARADLPS